MAWLAGNCALAPGVSASRAVFEFAMQQSTMASDPGIMNILSQRPVTGESIFLPGSDERYRCWRDAKLAAYPRSPDELTVEVSALDAPTAAETQAVLAACRRANMCLYRSRQHLGDAQATRRVLAACARHFGLVQFEVHRSSEADGIVALEIAAHGARVGYIPYTNRPLGWHTDGYYNYQGSGRMISSMVLHCVRSASDGGENDLLDHEIAYIRLRDENPDHIAALMRPDAMTIPANEEANGPTRAENTGPVFVVDPETGRLAMRYTARKRNIRWRDDAATHAAVRALERVLSDDPLIIRVKLAPGEGVICNNVLHGRSGFDTQASAEPGRLVYRIRSYDPVGENRGVPLACGPMAGCSSAPLGPQVDCGV
jgi:alpha-ketoglutarate-dependent taurine dioxygenase